MLPSKYSKIVDIYRVTEISSRLMKTGDVSTLMNKMTDFALFHMVVWGNDQ
jgi:hypothetical protein